MALLHISCLRGEADMSVAELKAPAAIGVEAPKGRGDTVLFVCTGNTCRSPMAAALYNDAVRKKACNVAACAISAGLYPAVGTPISPEAVTVLREAGVEPDPLNDYPAHRALAVSEELMKEATSVVAITASHAMELVLRYPQYAGKITVLPMDIEDPYARGIEAYRACLAQLQYCISVLTAQDGEGRV